MMNSIYTFVASCPLLAGIDLNVNALGEEPVSGAVENVSAAPVIKQYTDGATLRQYLFAISLRQVCGGDVTANSAAAALPEQISDWLEEQNRLGILPVLTGGKSAISLEVLKTSRLEEKNNQTASYRLKCRLVYYQD